MLPQGDVILVERLKNKDFSAFDELYLKYFKLLCTSAYFFLKNESDAKDVVQNLFVDIWEKKLYNNFHNDVKGYLFLAVKNRCLNRIKSQAVQDKRKEIAMSVGAALEQEQDPLPQPDVEAALREMLHTMKGQKLTAVKMVYLEGKKYKDAANEMGISVNSLKTHLKSALKMLRLGLKEKNH